MIMVDELKMWLPRQPRPFHEGSCHLTSDGPNAIDELHAFARKLGLKRGWFQERSSWPHYDLTPARRVKALELGAVFVPAKEQARARTTIRDVTFSQSQIAELRQQGEAIGNEIRARYKRARISSAEGEKREG